MPKRKTNNLTRSEAIQEMKLGKKVTHPAIARVPFLEYLRYREGLFIDTEGGIVLKDRLKGLNTNWSVCQS